MQAVLNVRCHLSWPPMFLRGMKPLGRFTEDYQNATQVLYQIHKHRNNKSGGIKGNKITHFLNWLVLEFLLKHSFKAGLLTLNVLPSQNKQSKNRVVKWERPLVSPFSVPISSISFNYLNKGYLT